MKRLLPLFVLTFSLISVLAQPGSYSTVNAHSHNDYAQKVPFVTAYKQQFGSIEADVFFVPGQAQLLVGHTPQEIKRTPRTLDSFYLRPLAEAISKNGDHVYSDASRTLQLMIDLKTEGIPTLDALIASLKKYPSLLNRDDFKILISGNKPDARLFENYPSFILFDANLSETYSKDALQKIGMISASFEDYSKWRGKGDIAPADVVKLKSDIDRAHAAGKKVRLWALPDVPAAWVLMQQLGVDFINTDRIDQLAAFLKQGR